MGRHTHPREGVRQRPRDRDAILITSLANAKPRRSLKCPRTPGKVRYKSKPKAIEAGRQQQILNGVMQRPYYCTDCQGFHLSSRPPKPDEQDDRSPLGFVPDN